MTMMVRLLVCGGRDYSDRTRVFKTLDRVNAQRGVSLLIHGGAPGADTLAGEWAKLRAVPAKVYEAAWDAQGKSAGPIRNQLMIDNGRPEAVVAFPGGSGTADMTRRAEAAGLKVWRPYG
jgi:predicted Rossmann-fold nucleotide-binding protein